MTTNSTRIATADTLIAAITAKLDANREVVEQSIAFGRIAWRRAKDGGFEIDLEPRI